MHSSVDSRKVNQSVCRARILTDVGGSHDVCISSLLQSVVWSGWMLVTLSSHPSNVCCWRPQWWYSDYGSYRRIARYMCRVPTTLPHSGGVVVVVTLVSTRDVSSTVASSTSMSTSLTSTSTEATSLSMSTSTGTLNLYWSCTWVRVRVPSTTSVVITVSKVLTTAFSLSFHFAHQIFPWFLSQNMSSK